MANGKIDSPSSQVFLYAGNWILEIVLPDWVADDIASKIAKGINPKVSYSAANPEGHKLVQIELSSS